MLRKIFDKFKRPKEEVAGQPVNVSTGADIAAILANLESNDTGEPRRHHYAFAHQFFPLMMKQNVLGLVNIMTGQRAQQFVEDMWDRLASDPTVDVALPRDGLSASMVDLGKYLICTIIMPPPKGPTEAFYTALVVPKREGWPAENVSASEWGVRYFACENGVFFAGEQRPPVLGEWFDGGHANLGDLPDADLKTFLMRIHEIVTGQSPG